MGSLQYRRVYFQFGKEVKRDYWLQAWREWSKVCFIYKLVYFVASVLNIKFSFWIDWKIYARNSMKSLKIRTLNWPQKSMVLMRISWHCWRPWISALFRRNLSILKKCLNIFFNNFNYLFSSFIWKLVCLK